MNRRRIVRYAAGTLIAPLATPLALGCLTSVLWLAGYEDFASAGTLGAHWRRTTFFLGVATLVAYAVMLVAGLPLATWSERRGRTGPVDALKLGAVAGGFPFVGYFACVGIYEAARGHRRSNLGRTLQRYAEDFPEAVVWLMFGIVSGVACAWVFWLLVWRGQPDGRAS